MSKISDLARALHQKTIEGKIHWEIQDSSSIYTHIGANSVFLSKDEASGRKKITMSIFDVKGAQIDEEVFHLLDKDYPLMEEMISKARRDLLKVDETLDEILTKVNDL